MKTARLECIKQSSAIKILRKSPLQKFRRAIICASVALLLACGVVAGPTRCAAQAESQISGANGQIIDKITVVGVKSLTPSAVIVLTGLQTGDKCTPDALLQARASLTKSGMFGMHNLDDPDEWVRFRVETTGQAAGHCELLILVDENDKITGADITGSGPIPVNDILSKLHLNAVFSTEQLERDRRSIQELYFSKGYLATFGADMGMDVNHPGTLTFPIIVARVRDIKIVGNHNTRAFVIRRELKTREGGYYNRKELSQDISRLADLGLFSDLDPGVSVVTPELVSINLKLTERKARTYNFGSSYGGGVLSGFVEVADNNFRGQDETLGVHIENGVASSRHSYQASFVEPYVDRKATSMTVSLFDVSSSVFSNGVLGVSSTSANSAGNLVQEKIGGSVQFNRPLRSGFVLQAGLKSESLRTDPLSLGGSSAALLQDGPLSIATGQLTHSSLDQRKDPASGALQTLTIGVGHADLKTANLIYDSVAQAASGSHNFVRASLDLQKYINLQQPRREGHPDDQRSTLAMRFQAASTGGTTPFSEQLFVGGSTGLRGYRDGRFWGQNMTTSTIELRQPLSKGFKGVLFAEAGDAWGGLYSGVGLQGLPQSGFKIHGATGLGVRVGTPVGLVRLDYGYGDEGGRVHFGIGYSF